MIRVAGNRRIPVARRRQQRHAQHDESRRQQIEPVRLPKRHGSDARRSSVGGDAPVYASRSSSAMCATRTRPLSPLVSWIMQAGQLVATTSAPLWSIACLFRSKILSAVS